MSAYRQAVVSIRAKLVWESAASRSSAPGRAVRRRPDDVLREPVVEEIEREAQLEAALEAEQAALELAAQRQPAEGARLSPSLSDRYA
jgi:hypothetical protein